jgi:hypothetical protein
MKMNTVAKRLAVGAELFALIAFLAGSTSLSMHAQTNNTPARIAAAVLPLPEALRGGATVVSAEEGGKYTVLRKGSNEMVCIGDVPGSPAFSVQCYHQQIFAVMQRRSELLVRAGKPARAIPSDDTKAVEDALDAEIKSGKLPLPTHPTIGFRMRGPRSGYDPATNTVSSQINAWQMVIIPYVTGATLALPEKPMAGMPWVMDSGTWLAHIMVEPMQDTHQH